MLKKPTFFKKAPYEIKLESKFENVSFKFTELSLDNVLEETENNIKSNIYLKISTNNIKDRQKDFAKNLFIQSQQIPTKSINITNRNSESEIFPAKKKILFPLKNSSSKRLQFREANGFSKYITPVFVGNLIKWYKYSHNRPHLDINELINPATEKPEIKKLVPNKYCLGTDIVPSYLLKKTKKTKTSNTSSSKPENKYHSIIKAHKAFGSYSNNEINITFIGSRKCGKSTIIGNILLYLDAFDNAFIKKTEWEAHKMNCPQYKSAWLIDTSTDERCFKETISMSSHYVEIKEKPLNLIDSPGNLCYYDQIIKSIIKSDCALLIINLATDWCPTALQFTHTDYLYTVFYLLKVFSVDKLQIIFANSFDESIEKPLLKIKSIWKKFSKTDPNHLTINNLSDIQTSELELLVDRIHRFDAKPSQPELDKPLLVEIIDIYKPVESALPVVVGSVVRGGISSGVNNRASRALVLPENLLCTVKSMKIKEKKEMKTRSFAFPGHLVEFTLPEINAEDKVKRGSFICHPEGGLSISNHFKVEMRIFDVDIDNPITHGMMAMLWSKCRSCFCNLTKILSVEYYEDKEKVRKKCPRLISKSGCTVTGLIRTDDSLAVEFHSAHKLDVFLLFSRLKLFAAGKFISIVD